MSPQHPASILQRHPGATIFLDAASAALLERPMLAKWGPFTELFAEIERASDGRETWRSNGAGH